MRTILFRGKELEFGNWVFGSLLNFDPIPEIQDTELEDGAYDYQKWEVTPETVGQFTGLKDKNGKDIYEGDILDSSEKTPLIFEVYYEDGGFRYGTKDRSVDIGFSGHTWLKNILTRFHVIGNIHDNPELLS